MLYMYLLTCYSYPYFSYSLLTLVIEAKIRQTIRESLPSTPKYLILCLLQSYNASDPWDFIDLHSIHFFTELHSPVKHKRLDVKHNILTFASDLKLKNEITHLLVIVCIYQSLVIFSD